MVPPWWDGPGEVVAGDAGQRGGSHELFRLSVSAGFRRPWRAPVLTATAAALPTTAAAAPTSAPGFSARRAATTTAGCAACCAPARATTTAPAGDWS